MGQRSVQARAARGYTPLLWIFAKGAFALYSNREHYILPFIGDAFAGKRPGLLRVVLVGTNTHIAPKDCYATNAIKVHMRDAQGNRANQISTAAFHR